ncbi:hypothetical protein [Actinomadura sp. WMMA1423]|uniref:hypothetical protein n=1 Tax=Actinomadura sp. WMMA1423 TaxID=2591108 RepID=UPI00143D8668|nr:hypothetical protein [Actinomadura sp. WMMA1423]
MGQGDVTPQEAREAADKVRATSPELAAQLDAEARRLEAHELIAEQDRQRG